MAITHYNSLGTLLTFGDGGNLAAGSSVYLAAPGGSKQLTEIGIPTGEGRLQNLRWCMEANSITGSPVHHITVYVNGVATPLSCEFSSGVTSGANLNTNVLVPADARVSIYVQVAGAAGNLRKISASVDFEPEGNFGVYSPWPQERFTLGQDNNIAVEMQTPSGLTGKLMKKGNLMTNSSFNFRVAASDGMNLTRACNPLLVAIPAKASENAIRLEWNAVVGATGYNLYREFPANSGDWEMISLPGTDTSYDYVSDSPFIPGMPTEATLAFINKISAKGDSWFSGGKVGVGVHSPSALLDVNGEVRVRGKLLLDQGLPPHDHPLPPHDHPLPPHDHPLPAHSHDSLSNSVGYALIMQGDGNLVVYQNGVARWASWHGMISDSRFKDDIQPLKDSLAKTLKLNGVSYHWKDGETQPGREIGLLAQEVQKVFPELVHDMGQNLVLNYTGLIPVLIEALKEQQNQIDGLRKMIKGK